MIVVYKILFSTCIPATVPEENRWHTQIRSSRDSSIKGQIIKTWAGRVRVQQPRASNQVAAPNPRTAEMRVENNYSTCRWKVLCAEFWVTGVLTLGGEYHTACSDVAKRKSGESPTPHSSPPLWSPASISHCHDQRKRTPAEKLQEGHLPMAWSREDLEGKSNIYNTTWMYYIL